MNKDQIESVGDLVSAMLDGRLSDDQKARLNHLLEQSPDAIARYHELLDDHEALISIYPGEIYRESIEDKPSSANLLEAPSSSMARRPKHSVSHKLMIVAAAASLLMVVGLGGYFAGSDQFAQRQTPPKPIPARQTSFQPEQTISGHAMLRRSVSVQWNSGGNSYRDGDVLPGGKLQIESGIAEIDFFCGATLTIEGPASLDIQSDWAVKVDSGRLRAIVPPAARGFSIQTDKAEIIDLGTEFALDVGVDNTRLEVIDGEVELRGGAHDGVHLTTGQEQWLGADSRAVGRDVISDSADIDRRRDMAEADRFVEWKDYSAKRRKDERLIAHYQIAAMPDGRVVPNSAIIGPRVPPSIGHRDAVLVGPVQRTSGRFGRVSRGLEFDRIGARVRTRIDGTFNAFTFATWVRIDSLDQVYNALFMSDGYETGELHWQIREDGALMFSVMVDDTQSLRHFSERDGGEVDAAGLHHVYYTKPIWDISKSGRWFHLTAVYDPVARHVTQYVNGEQASKERIDENFFIEDLKIGAAEIGNWGQPFRNSPWFAVRNLNGTIDEMTIYNAALDANEIHELYKNGKPLGY